MKTSPFTLLAVWAYLHAFAPWGEASPNFVFYLVDDVSPEDLGCYGGQDARTPHLDQLAEGGLRFENVYLVISSCSPSRCSIITGRYPHNHGAPELHTTLPTGQKTFVQVLQKAGYHTVLSGKNHMSEPGDASRLGFEIESTGKGPGKQEDWIELMRSRPRDKPFFFWFASSDAHRKWNFDEATPLHEPEQMEVPPYLYDGPKTRQDLADYFHEVSRIDAWVGNIRAELERQDVEGNTWFIFMADNGRAFPRSKTRLYDSGIKTPFLVYAPGVVEPGVR
ncbi:MAG: sulfatase-like hydrolase/transferase [Verrucomicrobiota bacterium]